MVLARTLSSVLVPRQNTVTRVSDGSNQNGQQRIGTLGEYVKRRDFLWPDEKILLWLDKANIGLKKSCFFLREAEGDSIQRGAIEFVPVDPLYRTFTPIYD
jgi:hypothetical protein